MRKKRTKINYWLVLFLTLSFLAVWNIWQEYQQHVFIDRAGDEWLAEKYAVSSGDELSGLENQQEKNTDCPSGEQQWQQLKKQAEMLGQKSQLAFLLDTIFQQSEKSRKSLVMCPFAHDFHRAFYNFVRTHHSDQLDTINFSVLFPEDSTAALDTMEYDKRYDEFQQRKQNLLKQTENNLLPGESLDEAYSRELNRLYQEIFERG